MRARFYTRLAHGCLRTAPVCMDRVWHDALPCRVLVLPSLLQHEARDAGSGAHRHCRRLHCLRDRSVGVWPSLVRGRRIEVSLNFHPQPHPHLHPVGAASRSTIALHAAAPSPSLPPSPSPQTPNPHRRGRLSWAVRDSWREVRSDASMSDMVETSDSAFLRSYLSELERRRMLHAARAGSPMHAANVGSPLPHAGRPPAQDEGSTAMAGHDRAEELARVVYHVEGGFASLLSLVAACDQAKAATRDELEEEARFAVLHGTHACTAELCNSV